MNRLLIGLLCTTFLGSVTPSVFAKNNVFTEPGIQKFLTADEATLAAVKRWQQTGRARPIVSDDGYVLYPFGQYQAKVICSPLRVCDIQLEPGEQVLDTPSTGDDVRWSITKGSSGSPAKPVTHVIVKPKDVGLQTNLIIRTDRRIYHIDLVSRTEGEYISQVGFYYPSETQNVWKTNAETEAKRLENNISPLNVDLDKIDASYEITGGSAQNRPIRAFNDGTKVYIQMPDDLTGKSWEAAALVLKSPSGENILTNYRIVRNYYIVDRLFDVAELLVGADGKDSKVQIVWKKNKDSGLFGSSWNTSSSGPKTYWDGEQYQ